MARIYLETSFVSACVSTRDDPASIFRRDQSREWWSQQAVRHGLFGSLELLAELSHPDYPNSAAALGLVASVPLLPIDENVIGLADILVREKVMPGPAAGDALHVAVATTHGMDYVLSWNVKHLANMSKMAHLRIICLRLGLMAPLIVTPDYLWE